MTDSVLDAARIPPDRTLQRRGVTWPVTPPDDNASGAAETTTAEVILR